MQDDLHGMHLITWHPEQDEGRPEESSSSLISNQVASTVLNSEDTEDINLDDEEGLRDESVPIP